MQKCFTIGITGGSGSGKTYFIKNLLSRFAAHEITQISQDTYYKPKHLQTIDENGIENFDLPTAIERERFYNDVMSLKAGKTISIPEYTFNNPAATANTIVIKPAPILIIEGLFVQYFSELSNEADLKIFIEVKDYIKLSRRILRDNDERGYDMHDVIYRYRNHVMPIYDTLIKPLKHEADLIIPNNHNFEKALNVLTLALKGKLAAM